MGTSAVLQPDPRDEMIVSGMDIPQIVARTIWYRMPQGVKNQFPLRDLVQQGMIGLIKAADSFRPEKGFKFKTFADRKVRGYILDYIRDYNHFRRHGRAARFYSLDSTQGLGFYVDLVHNGLGDRHRKRSLQHQFD
jgi:RNA polymerase sigma factor (sigma-70 family)